MLIERKGFRPLDTDAVEMLPLEEALLKFKGERIEPYLETFRLSDHDELKDFHRRSGQWLHSSELIYQVTRLNPMIFVEQQINYPDQWGFYVTVRGKQRYVSGFPKGWLREFTAIVVDERNLMEGDEIRGWRHVLVRLMGLGLLSWQQVVTTFGNSEGVNAERWRRYTWPFREGCADRIRENLSGGD